MKSAQNPQKFYLLHTPTRGGLLKPRTEWNAMPRYFSQKFQFRVRDTEIKFLCSNMTYCSIHHRHNLISSAQFLTTASLDVRFILSYYKEINFSNNFMLSPSLEEGSFKIITQYKLFYLVEF